MALGVITLMAHLLRNDFATVVITVVLLYPTQVSLWHVTTG